MLAKYLIYQSLTNFFKYFNMKTYPPTSVVYLLICIEGKESVLCGKVVCLDNSSHQDWFLTSSLFTVYLGTWYSWLEDSGFGCFVDWYLIHCGESILWHYTLASLESMIKIYEQLANDFVTYNVHKLFVYIFSWDRTILWKSTHFTYE